MPIEEPPLLKIVHGKERYEDLVKKIQFLVEDEDAFKSVVLDVISDSDNYKESPFDNGIKIIQTLINPEKLEEYNEILEKERSNLVNLFLTDYLKIFAGYKKEKEKNKIMKDYHIEYSSKISNKPKKNKTYINKWAGRNIIMTQPEEDERD